VAFSPDGALIACNCGEQGIKVWDARSGEELMTLEGLEGALRPHFSPDSREIVSGSPDGTVVVWDIETGEERLRFRGHKGYVVARFSPGGSRIASGGDDRMVRIWDAMTGAEMMTLRGHKNRIAALTFTPDGKRIVSGARFGMIKVWDAATGTEVMTLRSAGYRIAISPNGTTLAADTGHGIELWESKAPTGGFARRRLGTAAKRTVERLHKEQGSYQHVIEALNADEAPDKAVRDIALQIASARLWEDEVVAKEAER
jgi:hypothetical protein